MGKGNEQGMKPSQSDKKRERYMRAYYYTFTPTGCDAVDAILEAIAIAGKAYHNTCEWGGPAEYGAADGSPSHWDAIQDAADKAAVALSSETQAHPLDQPADFVAPPAVWPDKERGL